jgi:hypothetical protein
MERELSNKKRDIEIYLNSSRKKPNQSLLDISIISNELSTRMKKKGE